MTVTTTETRISYAGTGTTGPFDIPFKIFADGDVTVQKTVDATGVTSTLTLTTDYSITGEGAAGADLTTVAAVASGETLVIYLDLDYTQPTDFVNNDGFDADVAEDAWDRNALLIKQENLNKGYSVRAPLSDSSGLSELPSETARAGRYMVFDSNGDLTTSATASAAASGLYYTSSYTTLNAAVAAIGATEATLVINGPISMSANLAIPENVTLEKLRPGLISGAYTLTITGAGITGDLSSQWFNSDVTVVLNDTERASILWFGADRTETSDSSGAITRAWSALSTGADNEYLYIPSGRYKLSSGVTLSGKEGLSVKGDGDNSVLVSYLSSGTTLLYSGANSQGNTFTGFRITGEQGESGTRDSSESKLLQIDKTIDAVIDNLKINLGAATGLHLSGNENAMIEHLRVRDNGGWGIYKESSVDAAQSGTNITICNSVTKDNGATVTDTGNMALVTGGEHKIFGNQIEGASGAGTGRGLYVVSPTTRIFANSFENNDQSLNLSGSSDLVIRDNVIGDDIYMDNINGINLTENIFKNTPTITITADTNNKYIYLTGNKNPYTLSSSAVTGKVVVEKNTTGSTVELQKSETLAAADSEVDSYGADILNITGANPSYSVETIAGGHTGKLLMIHAVDANVNLNHSGASDGIYLKSLADLTMPINSKIWLMARSGTTSTARPVWYEVAYTNYAGPTAVSTGAGTVKMGSANPADNTEWYEVTPGKWVPVWDSPTP